MNAPSAGPPTEWILQEGKQVASVATKTIRGKPSFPFFYLSILNPRPLSAILKRSSIYH